MSLNCKFPQRSFVYNFVDDVAFSKSKHVLNVLKKLSFKENKSNEIRNPYEMQNFLQCVLYQLGFGDASCCL